MIHNLCCVTEGMFAALVDQGKDVQVEPLVPGGSCWLQWAGWVYPAVRGMCCTMWADGAVLLPCWGAHCSLVFLWSGSPLQIRAYRKGKDFLNFYKMCELPSKATSVSVTSITCARLYSCFSCFERTLLFLLQWRWYLVVPLLGSWG